jgi:hypothetical protein
MTETPVAARAALPTEQASFNRIAEQLALAFPDVPCEQVTAAVESEQARFRDSPIRDFVPILVERAVRRRWPRPDAVPRE